MTRTLNDPVPTTTYAADELLAEMLRAADLRRWDLPGVDLTFPVDNWGVRIKATAWAWVYVHRMMVNWRVIEVLPDPVLSPTHPAYPATGCVRSWCYRGDNPLAAVLAAAAWDGRPDTEPAGWTKQPGTERRHSVPTLGIRQMPYTIGTDQ